MQCLVPAVVRLPPTPPPAAKLHGAYSYCKDPLVSIDRKLKPETRNAHPVAAALAERGGRAA